MMKVLLNGATRGTNFGDYLFAQMFQDYVSEKIGEDNVFWYEGRYALSEFYKMNLKYDRKYRLKDIDALVCISGGYFCGDDHSFRDYILRYLAYFHIALKCIRMKKKIAIIAVEVGQSGSKLIDRIQRYILSKANLVVVRNIESLEQLNKYGVNNAICTADSVHAITEEMFNSTRIPVEIEDEIRPKIFLHIQFLNAHSVHDKIIPALNTFLAKHPEYCVVIGTDQYVPDKIDALKEISKTISCDKVFVYEYGNPIALCKVLNNMDFIITPKLHVGIVGATLGKSVVSFSFHTQKIARFYNQLEENGRSLPVSEFDEEKAVNMMETYHNIPITVPAEITEKAQNNFKILDNFLKGCAN